MARRGHRPNQAPTGRPRFWGRHAVLAALANPERTVRKLWGTREALASLDLPPVLPITYADVADLGRLVPADAPHQGLVAEVEPLDELWLGDLIERKSEARRPILVLDQVTDPHNVGAILRSAAAFDALGIVTQDRHAPPESGVVARAASGALEMVPWVRVVNLARALDDLHPPGILRGRLREGEHSHRLGGAGGRERAAFRGLGLPGLGRAPDPVRPAHARGNL